MPLHVASTKPSILWRGAFFNRHSLSRVNRELATTMLNSGKVDVYLDLAEQPTEEILNDKAFARLASRLSLACDKPDISIRHQWPPDFGPSNARASVLIQPWEFGSLPKEWVEGIAANIDEVWVPSNYVRECYIGSGVPASKVKVVPNGIDTSIFHPGVEPIEVPTTKSFKFLYVGGTISRKGIDVLLDAYASAFDDSSDVSLIIKDFGGESVYQGQTAETLIAAAQARPNAPEIVYLDSDMTDRELAGLYTACDCLVHAYRGEGFGLPIAEAMACGKPVVVTNHGAALDFVSNETGYLIPAMVQRSAEKRIGSMETVDYPFWAEPDVNALTGILQNVVLDELGRKERGLQAAAKIAEEFNWQAASAIALERCSALIATAAKINTAGVARTAQSVVQTTEVLKQEALEAVRAGRWMEAETKLLRVLAAGPDWDLENALSVAEFRLGKPERAIARLRKGIGSAPNARDFHHNLAYILLEQGEWFEALKQAIAALEFTPDSVEIRRTTERAKEGVTREARKIRGKLNHQQAKRKDNYRSRMELIARADDCLSGTSIAKETVEVAPAKPRLSIVMIAKNEEKFLRECLESVKAFADEIVLVDTGSTDKTVEIAKEFGAVIGNFEWCDDFAAARNAALDLATGTWGMWLDADERVCPNQADAVRKLVESSPADVGGYMISLRNLMTGGPNPDIVYHRACRMFRLGDNIRFEGRIHEQNVRNLQEAGYRIEDCGLTIDHLGYAAEVMDERNKHERFITMLQREVEENPDSFYRTFHLFNLGNALYTRGDMASSIRWFAMADESPDPTEEYTVMLYTQWATALYSTGQPGEALKACDRAQSIGISHPSIDFVRGHACLHMKEYKASERWFRQSLQRGAIGDFSRVGDDAVYGFKGYYGLALALTGQDNYEEAITSCQAALREKPNFTDARYLMGNSYLKLGRGEEAARELTQVLAESPDHELAIAELGMSLFELDRFSEAIESLRKASARQTNSAAVWQRYALCCEHLDLMSEARTAFERVRTLLPRSAEVQINLGRVYAALGESALAAAAFSRAIQLDPTDANAFLNAGDLLYRLGDYKQAADALHAGLRLNPANANGLFVLGNCYYHLGQLDAARGLFEGALELSPNYAEARNNLELVNEARELVAA
jgi:tetratricopeptide (TPR) repeat protein